MATLLTTEIKPIDPPAPGHAEEMRENLAGFRQMVESGVQMDVHRRLAEKVRTAENALEAQDWTAFTRALYDLAVSAGIDHMFQWT